MSLRICALVAAGVVFVVGCSGGGDGASTQELSESSGGAGNDAGSGSRETSSDSDSDSDSTSASSGSGTDSGAGGTAATGDGGTGSRLSGPPPGITTGSSDTSSGGSGMIGQQLTSTSSGGGSDAGGAGGTGGATVESSTTTNETCECEEGDPCCDGCQIVAEGCTGVAAAACEMAVDARDVFACPREDWETTGIEWRCPSNMGDDGVGLGCPELGPLDEFVGDFEDIHPDLALKFAIKVDCMGQLRDRMRICVNFENNEFDQCVEECQ